MATIGYARVSTEEQSLEEQVARLEKAGADVIYKEKITGTRRDRPELEHALMALREGDRFMVVALDRLGRSLRDLVELEELITAKGATFVSLREAIDTTTAAGKFMLQSFAAAAEFEARLARERTAAAMAHRPPEQRGGRPRAMTPKTVAEARRLRERNPGLTTEQIARAMGVGRTTLLRYLRDDGTPVPRGGHRGGRPPKLTPTDVRKVRKLHREGRSLRQIAVAVGCSKSTVQRVLRGQKTGSPASPSTQRTPRVPAGADAGRT